MDERNKTNRKYVRIQLNWACLRYNLDPFSKDDLLGVLNIQALKCQRTYDPHRGCSYRSYLITCLRNATSNYVRDYFYEIYPNTIHPRRLDTMEAKPHGSLKTLHWKDIFKAAGLSDKEAARLLSEFQENNSRKSIEESEQLSSRSMQVLAKRALNKVKRYLKSIGINSVEEAIQC